MNSEPSAPDPDLVSLGQTIRRLRRENKLSQEKLAEAAGLSTNYVSDVERGTRNLGVKALFQIARALGVEVVTLFSR